MAIVVEGQVRLTGDPRDLIAGLTGRIWQKEVERQQVPGYRASGSLISTRLFAGRTVLHVFSDSDPGDAFEPVQPDLEDVYFANLSEVRRESAAGSRGDG